MGYNTDQTGKNGSKASLGILPYRQGLSNIARFRFGAAAVLIAATVAMVLVSLEIEALIERQFREETRSGVTLEWVEHREDIEAATFELFITLQSLAAQITSYQDESRSELDRAMAALSAENDQISAVFAEPDSGEVASYPAGADLTLSEIENSIGSRGFLDEPNYANRRTGVLLGPVSHADGSKMLLLKHRVYSRISIADRISWGTISIAVDLNRFLEEIGIEELAEGFEVFIGNEAENFGSMTSIYGDRSLAWKDPVEFELEFPNGSWTIMVIPEAGWPLHSPYWLRNRLIMFATTAFVIIVLSYIMRLSESRYQSEVRLNNAIRAMENGLAIFDSNGQLQRCNDKYIEIYNGISDLIKPGSTLRDLSEAVARRGIVADAIGSEDQWIAERIATQSSASYVAIEKMTNGRILRVSHHRMEDGGTVFIHMDITRLQNAVADANAANVAKTQFINALSHELRTPLTVILGLSGIAKLVDRMPVVRDLHSELEKDPSISDEVKSKVENVIQHLSKLIVQQEKSGQHLLSLINEMLDFAKIESGTFAVECSEASVREILEPLESQLEVEVRRKGLLFEVQRDDGDVYADAFRTRQILYNLIGNALKFTEKGKISIHVERSEQTVKFAVHDTGQGISLDEIDRIFEAFHQVDSSVTRQRGGTGLGLAISRELAQAQGGSLSVESELGVGSVFTLTLPANAHDPKIRNVKACSQDRGDAA